eukprot:TRINITY_DN6049_c0_g1_i1.p1 TRINITY_DN6049_c0_g1~~TRINITY_DN6049_c0_g1_i1.p1  ORF type:complete len:429 (+),score=114.86 TRINITY_DN6049_c0_g1_i1:499-1785(+)
MANHHWITVALAVVAMLIAGGTNTLSLKFQNNREAAGYEGDVHGFAHAGTQTLIMFVGEACVLLWGVLAPWLARKWMSFRAFQKLTSGDAVELVESGTTATDVDENGDDGAVAAQTAAESPLQRGLFRPIILLPTALDALSTLLSAAALVYVHASSWQLLRGSYLIFAGAVSVVLRQSVKPHQWLGIAISVAGTITVGTASFLDSSADVATSFSSAASSGTSGWVVVLWTVVVVISQLPRAIKSVLEEKCLKVYGVGEFELLGTEGVFGSAMTVLVAMPLLLLAPGSQPGPLPWSSYDNTADAVLQMVRCPEILAAGAVYFVSVQVYGMAALRVTGTLSAVDRAVVDTARTAFVWGAQLAAHYVVASRYGEAWTRWSWLQAAGFATATLAVFVSNGTLFKVAVAVTPRFVRLCKKLRSAACGTRLPNL